MTLLSLVQQAADEIGIARPTLVVAGTDPTTRRLLAVANREGKSLARLNWPKLRFEKTFTSVAQEVQTGALAADWARFVDRTFWNRTASRPLIGPIPPDEWQGRKAHPGSGPTDSFTYRGSDILITPNPAAGHTMAYEYHSKNWCESSGGTDQSAWAADTDTGILDEDLMSRGVVWRFKKASAMEWVNDFNDYVAEVRTALGQSEPAGMFDMSGETWITPKPGLYVPERDWQ